MLVVPVKSDLLLLVPMFMTLSLIRPFVVPLASDGPLRMVPPPEKMEDVATDADLVALSDRLVVNRDLSVFPEK